MTSVTRLDISVFMILMVGQLLTLMVGVGFSIWLIMVLILIVSLSGVMIFRYLILKPISELTERTQTVLDGDLTQDVSVKAMGTIGVLAETVNKMTEGLRNLVKKNSTRYR